MRAFPLAVCVLLGAGARAQVESPPSLDLRFVPADRILVVEYLEDQSWDYGTSMKGHLHTELGLRWEFEPTKKGALARGVFHSVVYRGEGVKSKRDWKYDLLWKREGGYVRGKGSEAAKKWVDEELKEGVALLYDKRAATKPGEC